MREGEAPSVAAGSASSAASGGQYGQKRSAALYRQELIRLLALTGPLCVQNVFGYAFTLFATAFVGHLGDATLLSSIVLGGSLYNLAGQNVLVGIASALETIGGQAVGARNYKLLGQTLQRAVLICWAVCVPIGLSWLNVGPVLNFLGQSHVVVKGASRYLMLIIPGLFFESLSVCLDFYLLVQQSVVPFTIITIINTLLCPVFYWLMIFKLALGAVEGAAYALVLSNASMCASLVAYVGLREAALRQDPARAFHGLSMDAFRGWPAYLHFGLPAAAMMCMEGWFYECMIWVAGLLPDPQVEVAVMGLCLQLSSCVYVFTLSCGMAVNTRVANELGAGNAAGAARATRVAMVVVFLTGTAAGLLILGVRTTVVRALTSSEELVHRVAAIYPVVAANVVGDGLNCVLGSVLRAAGRQRLGAGLNLVGYWCVGIPTCVLLAFGWRLGVLGIWIGLAGTTNLQALIQLFVVWSLDWDVETRRAAKLCKPLTCYNEGEISSNELESQVPLLLDEEAECKLKHSCRST